MEKKGAFDLLDDIIVYILFIGLAVLFLGIASFVANQGTDNSLTSDFDSLESDTVLLNLMRTSSQVDIDMDGKVDTSTIADLISLDAEKRIMDREVKKAMRHVCEVQNRHVCSWKLEIEGKGIIQPNFEYDSDRQSTSQIHIPVKNEEREVVKVEYTHFK